MAERQGFFSRFLKSRRKNEEHKCDKNPTAALKGNSQTSRKFHRFPIRPPTYSEGLQQSSHGSSISCLDLTQAFDGAHPKNVFRRDLLGFTAGSEGTLHKEAANTSRSMMGPDISGRVHEGTKYQSKYLGKQCTYRLINDNDFGNDITAPEKELTSIADIEQTKRKHEPPAGNTRKARDQELEFLFNFFEGIRDEIVTLVDNKGKSRNRTDVGESTGRGETRFLQSPPAEKNRTRTTAMNTRETHEKLQERLREPWGITQHKETLHIAGENTEQKVPKLDITSKPTSKSDIPFTYIPRNDCRKQTGRLTERKKGKGGEKKQVVKFSEEPTINRLRTTADEFFLSDLCAELEGDIALALTFDNSSTSSASLATQRHPLTLKKLNCIIHRNALSTYEYEKCKLVGTPRSFSQTCDYLNPELRLLRVFGVICFYVGILGFE